MEKPTLESIEKDIDIRIIDQRIGMGIGGYDLVLRMYHKPTGILVEVPNRISSGGSYKSRQIAKEMILYALIESDWRE